MAHGNVSGDHSKRDYGEERGLADLRRQLRDDDEEHQKAGDDPDACLGAAAPGAPTGRREERRAVALAAGQHVAGQRGEAAVDGSAEQPLAQQTRHEERPKRVVVQHECRELRQGNSADVQPAGGVVQRLHRRARQRGPVRAIRERVAVGVHLGGVAPREVRAAAGKAREAGAEEHLGDEGLVERKQLPPEPEADQRHGFEPRGAPAAHERRQDQHGVRHVERPGDGQAPGQLEDRVDDGRRRADAELREGEAEPPEAEAEAQPLRGRRRRAAPLLRAEVRRGPRRRGLLRARDGRVEHERQLRRARTVSRRARRRHPRHLLEYADTPRQNDLCSALSHAATRRAEKPLFSSAPCHVRGLETASPRRS